MGHIIISGASSGIGADIAKKLNGQGYSLSLLGRNQDRLNAVRNYCEGEVDVYNFDFTSTDDIRKFCEKWLQKNDVKLTAIIFNAGNIARHSFVATPMKEWQQQFDISVTGPVYMIQKFWQKIISDKTNILTISSTLGMKPIPDTAAYSCGKSAMISWTQSLAAELASNGNRVNCICHGIVETPIHGNTSEEWHNIASDLVPLGRPGQPKDIAEMANFLMSDSASWITGQSFVVDGGLLSLK